jgi:hypothetical protein
MIRRLLPAFALIALSGCQSLQEQEAIRPLRENGPKLTYEELLLRARRQGDLAMDRAFRNNWADVQDVSTALEQTVKLIPTAPEAPQKKTEIIRLTTAIEGESKKLGQAAKEVVPLTGTDREKKIKEIDAILLKISRDVRTLWSSN